MGKKIINIAILTLFVNFWTQSNLFAEDVQTQSGLIIKHVYPGDNGIYIKFTSLPAGCLGEYKSAHAFLIKSSIDETNKLFRNLTVLRIQKKSVVVKYIDIGDCTTRGTLLNVLNIE